MSIFFHILVVCSHNLSDFLNLTHLLLGCIQELKLNDERLPMSDAQTDKFDIVVSGSDSIKPGCDGCPASVSVCGDGFTCDASSGL